MKTNFPSKILLGIQEGLCNLSCPKCYTHGKNVISSQIRSKGLMPISNFVKILDEAMHFKPRIAPQTWDEPFINPNFINYLFEIKKRGLITTIDTNGLLISPKDLHKLIELKVDSIFFSVDAMNEQTYTYVRGKNKLNFLKELIHSFLNLRGDALFPRIGVSFVVENENEAELSSFIEYWQNYVDVIRVNKKFESGRKIKNFSSPVRNACWSLYDSLMVHHNGEAALCCVDNHYDNKIGNVFEQGILKIWQGSFFNSARSYHEKNQFDKIKICETCDLWSNEDAKKTETAKLLISETATHTYFNRKDRLNNIVKNRYL